ncbi:MAG: acyl carrier protein [Lachnospiraceae bacterium]|jgi:acyl carrier protein|nr:acyl carrier protein [Lachnospiraceae bacterium]MBQ3793879.1 acyl carrier protein [Lachnospiraceae bacterium]MBR1848736.1 acyl carrier protein [Lachnospiraceae bacterium]MCR5321479.1 acyl carrier protein [Lachnospiraceae bacterium]
MLEKIAAFIEEQLGTVKKEDITPETSFKDDLGADSLDLLELVMSCEREYGIEIPTKDLENIHTVGDVIEYIEAQGK